MILMRIYVVSFILICSAFSGKAQTQDSTLLAQREKAFRKEILEMEYKIFSENKDSIRNLMILEKASLLKKHGLVKKALMEYKRLDVNKVNRSLGESAVYNKILINYALSNFAEAYGYLEEYDIHIPDSLYRNEIYLLRCLVYNVKGQTDKGKLALIKYNSALGGRLDVDSVYQFTEEIKDPDKAVLLSSIFPGLGQIYAGKLWQGLNSTLLSAIMVAYGVYTFQQKMFSSTVFTSLSLFAGFYRGGKRNAEYIARQNNARVITDVNQSIIKWSEERANKNSE